MHLDATFRISLVSIALVLMVTVLTGCGIAGENPTPTVEPSPDVSPTAAPTVTSAPTEPAPTATPGPTDTPADGQTPDSTDGARQLPNVSELRWEEVSDAPGTLRRLAGNTTDVVQVDASPDGRWLAVELVSQYLMGGPARTALYVLDTTGEGANWSVTHEDRSDWQQHVWLDDNTLLYIHRGELEKQSFDEITQIESPERLYEIWLGDDIVLASGYSALWRYSLDSGEWEQVTGLEDVYAEEQPPISVPQANVTVAPDGTYAALMYAGQLWRVPLTMGEPAERLATVDYLGRGGRIFAPEPLSDSPYWYVVEPVPLASEGDAPPLPSHVLLDTRDGSIVPVNEILAQAGVDMTATDVHVSPNGRFVAVGMADAGSSIGAPPQAFYLAPADDLAAGRVVEGTQFLDWRIDPLEALIHDQNTGQIQSVPPAGGEPTMVDLQLGAEGRLTAQATSNTTYAAENADLYAFDLDGTQRTSYEAPAVVSGFFDANAADTVAFGTSSGEQGASTTELYLWDVANAGTQEPDETDSSGQWERYQSDELGVSIEHPASWTVRRAPEDAYPTLYINSNERFGEGPEPIEYYVYISEYDNSNGATFENVVAEQAGIDPAQLTYSRDSIGPYTVYRTTSIPSRNGALTVFFTDDGSRYVSIALTPYDQQDPFPEQARFVETFEQMLSTVDLEQPQVAPTVTPAPQSTPTATQAGGFTRVNIFLIAEGDDGQSGTRIGCGDSVVPVEVQVEATRAPLTAAINELLSLEERTYGQSGLTTALAQSDLRVERIVIENGTAVIELAGAFQIAGTCDAPRVEAQLTETALQFSTVNDVEISINGRPLDDVLDQRG